MKNEFVTMMTGILVGCLIGFFLLPMLTDVKKYTVVTFAKDMSQVNYESNLNREGDVYFIIVGRDTVARGIIENGEWVEP